jgi:hypothetical protein
VKTFAIVLIAGIGLYAIYDLFSGSSLLGSLGAQPGTNVAGVDIPGVPAYSAVGTVASNLAGTSIDAQTAATTFESAFGAGGNDVSSDEVDVDFD